MRAQNETKSNPGQNGGNRSGTQGSAHLERSNNWQNWNNSHSKHHYEPYSGQRCHREKWCSLHKQFGHDNLECKVIQAQVKCLKAEFKAKGHNISGKRPRNNNENPQEAHNINERPRKVDKNGWKPSKSDHHEKVSYESSKDEDTNSKFASLSIEDTDTSDSE